MGRFIGALVGFASLLLASAADGQGVQTGSIRGVAMDAQGLVMPGVTIVATSPALQGAREVASLDDGSFAIPLLPPGVYQVRYQFSGFRTLVQTATVPLGGSADLEAVLEPGPVTEAVTVVAAETPVATASQDLNVRAREVNRLPVGRDPAGVAQLSAGVTDRAFNPGQVLVHGAFGFDNAFMVNGVDINDNLFGYAQRLFIEDAIEETQILTAGVSAEYGRFTGGVVNQITKRGGNTFSGSLRVNVASPSWTVETPRERAAGLERPANLTHAWESTFGGPLRRDVLWFFLAGRLENLSVSGALPLTATPYTEVDRDRRGEVKLTATPWNGHTVEGSYLNSRFTQEDAPSTVQSIDTASLVQRHDSNWYTVGSYRGAATPRTLIEAQFAARGYRTRQGGTLTSIGESPFLSFDGFQFNAPIFDAADPTERNSQQVTGNATRLLEGSGTHELKGGYEWFRSRTRGAESPSATGYLFLTGLASGDDGILLRDSNQRPVPQFVPGETARARFVADRGATMDVDTHSFYVQDRWRAARRLSFDLGVRVEHATSVARPGRVPGVDATTAVPRLAASYDPSGRGQHVVRGTYGWYTGRYIKSLVGANNGVTNPATIVEVYLGPPGEGLEFAPGFDDEHYLAVEATFPTANVTLDPDLRAPITREISASYGLTVPRGHLEASYVRRRSDGLIEDFRDIANGVTVIPDEGLAGGAVTHIVWRNTDLANRRYDALLFQGRHALSSRVSVSGAYTLQLRNHGNYEGERPLAAGSASAIGDFPEAASPERTSPDGRLPGFQRHRVRTWAVYTPPLGRLGDLSIAGLWRVDSGATYSLTSQVAPTDLQRERLLAAGYPDIFLNQTVYFGSRGAGTFDGNGLIDASFSYGIPVLATLGPFVKVDIYNLFDNQKVIGYDTTVVPAAEGPVDAIGLPLAYEEAAGFGQPDDDRHYPTPLAGLTGGRTVRIAGGIRF